MQQLLDAIPTDSLTAISMGLLRFLAIISLAFLTTRIVSRVILSLRQRFLEVMNRGAGGNTAELDKRATTLVGLIRKTAVLAIWAVATIMALRELGFDVAPLLAGAGVLGLAVGFGAQNLVRDVITGLFMLIENQVRVNDVAVINGTGGLVEEVNLRTTVLRSLDGTVHVFPNGTITTLANMTREFSYYVFDIGVAYKEDTDRVVDVIREVAEELGRSEGFATKILAPVEIFGLDRFADSAVMIKGRIKTRPIEQWSVGREFNRRLKRRFDELKIEIPFPHRSLYFGEASPEFRISGGGPGPEQLREVIREVLAESGNPGEAEK
jgi:small conductance mechanosensitive channel